MKLKRLLEKHIKFQSVYLTKYAKCPDYHNYSFDINFFLHLTTRFDITLLSEMLLSFPDCAVTPQATKN